MTCQLARVEEPDGWQDPSEEIKLRFYDISKNNPEIQQTISSLTKDQRDEWTALLVQATFEIAGRDWRDHDEVYHACIAKCNRTRVLDAYQWSEWGGQNDARRKLSEMYRFSRQDRYIHVLPASTLVAIVVLKVLRNVQTRYNDDQATIMLRNLRQFDYLGFAIDNYKPGIKFIATDVPWGADPDLRTDIQPICPPRQTVQVSIKRDEALAAVGELIRQVSVVYNEGYEAMEEDGYKVLAEQLLQALTEQMVMVLPEDDKKQLWLWSMIERHDEICQWTRGAKEDKTEHTWEEEVVGQEDGAMADHGETERDLLKKVLQSQNELLQNQKQLVQNQKELLQNQNNLAQDQKELLQKFQALDKSVLTKTTDTEETLKNMLSFMRTAKEEQTKEEEKKKSKKQTRSTAFDDEI
ncbi:hypothetical protein HDV63DRAFT_407974 [Trichoderma sp. SZMC 28014]